MKLTKYFSITVATTSLTVLATYGARLNPTFLPLLAVVKPSLTICFAAYLFYESENQKKLVATAFTVGGWLGIFIGYFDFLRVWWDYFQTDVIAWIIVIFILLVLGGFCFAFIKQRMGTEKRQTP